MFLFLVTPYLVVAVQLCMEWIPIKQKTWVCTPISGHLLKAEILEVHECVLSSTKYLGSNIFLKVLSRHLFEIVIYLETFDVWKYEWRFWKEKKKKMEFTEFYLYADKVAMRPFRNLHKWRFLWNYQWLFPLPSVLFHSNDVLVFPDFLDDCI